MAEPAITWFINVEAIDTTPPSWGAFGAGDTLKFTGPNTVADTSWDKVTRPASGYKVADELWIDAASDLNCLIHDEHGGLNPAYSAAPSWTLDGVSDFMAIQAVTNPETSAGNLTAWDTNAHSTSVKEILNDMDGNAYSWLRAGESQNNVAHGAASATDGSDFPSGFDTQTDATTTFQLKGSTYSIDFSGACSANNENRFPIFCFVPHDATEGYVGIHDPVLTYTYYWS